MPFPRSATLVCSALAALAPACAPQPRPHDASIRASADRARADAPLPATGDQRVAALVDGRPVLWDELAALTFESAGGAVLEELALDRALAQEARRAGVAVGPEALARERSLMVEALAAGAGVSADPDAGERLLAEVRRSRGLGPRRFDALLRRSATLRALVRDDAPPDPAALQRAFEMLHGERRRARLITVDTAREAGEAADRLRAGEPFGEVAARLSTDASAARGGLIEPLSALDPAYPQALRTALARLEPGQSSGVLSLERGFALVRLEEVIPTDGRTLDQTRPEVERALRLTDERRRMDALAARLLRSTSVTPMDAGLRQSWDWRRPPAP